MPERPGVIERAIAFIEFRAGVSASNISAPDEENRSSQAVDRRFLLGERLVVLEHSRVQSFPQQIATGVRWNEFFAEISQRLRGRLPNDGLFIISTPPNAMNFSSSRHRRAGIESLEQWIFEKAPLLAAAHGPFMENGTFVRETPQTLGFEVCLSKIVSHSQLGEIQPRQLIGDDLENQRRESINQLLSAKLRKLRNAKLDDSAHTSVLIIECNDVGLGASWLIRAGLEAEISRSEFAQLIPDDIYLIETSIAYSWGIYVFRDSGTWISNHEWYVYRGGAWQRG